MTNSVLEAYKEAQQKKLKEIAEDVIKYQNFKNSIAVEKMRATHLAKSSRYNYIACGRHYLKTGQRYRNVVGGNFYNYLQDALDRHVQPLVPSFDEKLRVIKKNYTKKEAKPPITKIIETNKKLTTNIEYGIKINDKIVLETNEDRARAFLKGIKFLSPNVDAKLITVELTEVK